MALTSVGHGTSSAQAKHSGLFWWYHATPLYVRIMIALVFGAICGKWIGPRAIVFAPFSDIVLRLLRLLATPLIFVAVVHALLKANATGKSAARLAWLLISNTTVAILIGLLVANTVRPGYWAPFTTSGKPPDAKPFNAASEFLSKIPGNFVDPFQSNEILSIIFVAISFGIAMRIVRSRQIIAGQNGYRIIEDLMETIFQLVMVTLQWIFHLVPLAVFGVVAHRVGEAGFKPLLSMAVFVVAVVLALVLQAVFYLTRLRLGSWVRPGRFLHGASDALTLAFSTASSAATLPVTYSCMRDKVGIREESAGLGIMVGGTFNHDGTALYEAMAALFASQALGFHLSLGRQVIVVLMSIVASVGAAGIPEAGLVTMLAVFTAVDIPIKYVPLLIPLDWFLDRCRTCINVMGDMSVACLLDGKQREVSAASVEATVAHNSYAWPMTRDKLLCTLLSGHFASVDITGMKLCRLMYISDATRSIGTRELTELVEHCRINNEKRGVSGLLLYSGMHFMQVLEGDPMQVGSLYDLICNDPRHTDARRLQFKVVDKRLFPEWGMQLASVMRQLTLDRERIDKTLLRLRMSQGEGDATEAIALMQEFRRQVMEGAA